jgi:hypothetical protein
MTRQKRLLLILLGIFALALIYGILNYPKQQRVERDAPPPAAQPRPSGTGTVTPPGPESERPPVAEEEIPADEEADVRRNIFAPLYPYVPPPAPKVVLPPNGLAQPGPVQPPPPPPFQLIGYLEKNQERLFFLAQANDLFIVRPEEVFGPDNRYRIVEVEPSEVIIETIDGLETIRLPISSAVSSIESVGRPAGVLQRPSFPTPPPAVQLPVPESPAAMEEELPPEEDLVEEDELPPEEDLPPGNGTAPPDSGTLNAGDGDVPEDGAGDDDD